MSSLHAGEPDGDSDSIPELGGFVVEYVGVG